MWKPGSNLGNVLRLVQGFVARGRAPEGPKKRRVNSGDRRGLTVVFRSPLPSWVYLRVTSHPIIRYY